MKENETIENLDELLNSIIVLLRHIGLSLYAGKLERIVRNKYRKEFIDEYIDNISEFILSEEDEENSHILVFGDPDNRVIVRKHYIASAIKKWSDTYDPLLIINEMPDGTSLKDNPIRNLVIKYRDVECRDRDFDRVKRILSQ